VGEEGVALKDNADAAAIGRQVVDTLTIEQHAAVCLANEAGNDPQQRGFAATRWPEQSDDLAGADAELYVIDCDKISKPMGDALEPQIVAALSADGGGGDRCRFGRRFGRRELSSRRQGKISFTSPSL
jgi:hypothetical protein